jgi:hypothetical protein
VALDRAVAARLHLHLKQPRLVTHLDAHDHAEANGAPMTRRFAHALALAAALACPRPAEGA